ncbi:Hypothetical predicted protein [Olea europaea subsp. europaea]|uniref:Uncharacterized protein n=1 Tax=Olea europaea subsp. europaea TaxID=158383 RepID=A0A8S0VAL2_OLEEU|nr:Hypothetical predicted protein [Olea europaea subsp. europaea]
MWLRDIISSNHEIVDRDARPVARRLRTRNHVCSFVSSVAPSVCACQRELTVTNNHALATTIGRLKKAVLNALKPAPSDNIFLIHLF